MPRTANSRVRAAATSREAAKRNVRDQGDSDYEDEPTPPSPPRTAITSFFHRVATVPKNVSAGVKRGAKSAEELLNRKRRRENDDLIDKSAPKKQSRMTIYREEKGLTKKARAKNMHITSSSFFVKPTMPALDSVPLFLPNGQPLNSPAPSPPTSILPPIEIDSDSDIEITDIPNGSPASMDSDIEMPHVDVLLVDAEVPTDIPACEPASFAVEPPSDEGPAGTEDDAELESPANLSLAAINIQYDSFKLKLDRYGSKHCSARAIAKDTTSKAANRKLVVLALQEYAKQRRNLERERVMLAQQIDCATPLARYKLRQRLAKIKPEVRASERVAYQQGKTKYWARNLRSIAREFLATGEIAESNQGKGAHHATHFDNPDVKPRLDAFCKRLIPPEKPWRPQERRTCMCLLHFIFDTCTHGTPQISPQRLRKYVNEFLLPELEITTTISLSTALAWLKKLGYSIKKYQKGIYFDGHERPDVVQKRKEFIKEMLSTILPLSYQYDDVPFNKDDPTDDPKAKRPIREVPPTLKDGQKIFYPIFHDETSIHANDQTRYVWEREDEHELRSKSRGRIVHVSDFIIEHCGRLYLSARRKSNNNSGYQDVR
ncbi:DDE family endonuclease [Mycena indigotica]|uniref:DDE family endonuclease n=1 Tax=Mycena indigotica TaxID=2126181 RepID=A0A8H6VV31_9AGAR|nr:DDE family endonuclease [Mycena indigotica]KAF7291198.1 DDE family endonuclease [Mycena indigotica]